MYLVLVKFLHCFLHTPDVVHTMKPGETGDESSVPCGWRQETTLSAWEHAYPIEISQPGSGRGWDKYETSAEHRKEKCTHLKCEINSYTWSICSERVVFTMPKESSMDWADLGWSPWAMEETFHFLMAFPVHQQLCHVLTQFNAHSGANNKASKLSSSLALPIWDRNHIKSKST